MQLTGTATVHDERHDPGSVAAVLRRQLHALQPELAVADPAVAHPRQIQSILGISIAVDAVSAKFKYGGNVDEAHRLAVVDHLEARHGPGDAAAAGHVVRRLAARRPDGSDRAELSILRGLAGVWGAPHSATRSTFGAHRSVGPRH